MVNCIPFTGRVTSIMVMGLTVPTTSILPWPVISSCKVASAANAVPIMLIAITAARVDAPKRFRFMNFIVICLH